MENNKKSFVEQMKEYESKLLIEQEDLKNKISALSSVEDSLTLKAKRQLKKFKERVNEIARVLEENKKDAERYFEQEKECKKSERLVKKERKADTKEELVKSLEQKQKNLLKLENEILSKYNLDEANESEVEVIEDEEDDYTDENERTTGSISKKKALLVGGVSVVALLAALGITKNKDKIKEYAATAFATRNTQTEEVMEETEQVAETTERAVETYDVTVFDDITDEAKLDQRVSEIVEEITPMLGNIKDSFDDKDLNLIIKNIILTTNGELPVDENGNKYYNPDVLGMYDQYRCEIFGNLPSSPQHGDKLYKAHWEDLFLDNSDAQEFARKYDELFNGCVEATNAADTDMFKEYAIKYGEALYNDWVLQGMYTGENPYNIENVGQKYSVLSCALDRFSTVIVENRLGHRMNICVPVCINYETGEKMEIPLTEIHEAIALGKSNNATLHVGASDGFQIIGDEFFVTTKESLEDKYNELKENRSYTLN